MDSADNNDQPSAEGQSPTPPQPNDKKTYECGICFEEFDLPTPLKCPGGHVICSKDVQRMFELAIKGDTPYPPRCCGKALPMSAIRGFLPLELLSKLQQFLKAQGEKKNEEGEQEVDEADRAFVERSISHGEMQLCPGCNCRVYQTEGCSHMRCELCFTEFCYLCGGIYNQCHCERHAPLAPQLVARILGDMVLNEPNPRRVGLNLPLQMPQHPNWIVVNARIGIQHGFSIEPEDCEHEEMYQVQLGQDIETHCCARDTNRWQCQICGYQHCWSCGFRPQLGDANEVD